MMMILFHFLIQIFRNSSTGELLSLTTRISESTRSWRVYRVWSISWEEAGITRLPGGIPEISWKWLPTKRIVGLLLPIPGIPRQKIQMPDFRDSRMAKIQITTVRPLFGWQTAVIFG